MNLEKPNKNIIFCIAKKEFKMMYKSSTFYASSLFFILGAAFGFIGTDSWFNAGLSDLKTFFLNMPFLFCIIIPMLTMSLWSDEKKQFTDKFLFSLPVPIRYIVLGKYVSLIFIWLIMIGFSIIIPLSVFPLIYLDVGAFIVSYFSIFLFGAGIISFSSALAALSPRTEINFLFSFLTVLFFTFIYPITKNLNFSLFLHKIISYLSFSSHFDSAARGLFDSADIFFYFLLIALGIELSVFILTKQRDAK
ncbi:MULTISPECIES: ABC transporter permease [unclassified Treponema]|uniref:ABC transporter permease n=1 Tax=unclassified Treponema TaxID=2638727 RepID=UPI0020A31396|nr:MULTISPECIES: ABC transporter permease [unclassified Treponema]UTC67666.1 ABC transporter permease subunit [Treponema sp. OMZ 789]UTC70394.1 ABC transporter permease subunit [Treponema sp. OMZ 790]UTC73108.1 ABC transporter permease subunit [Treponema sp. OMZ 791]